MSRIRSIHPGIFTDEAFMSASAGARLLIIGLWTEADDQGVFEWKPVTIKARLFAADMVDAQALLEELVQLGFICKFDGDGKPLGAIRNFRKWQRPKKPTSAFPLPDHLVSYVGLEEVAEDAEQALRRRKHAQQDGKCAYCRTGITYYSKRHDSLEIDHVIPKCREGSDDEDNLVAACRNCNRSKGSMIGDEFRAWLRARLSGASFPKIPKESAKGGFAPQMEDGGWRMEDGGGKVEKKESAPQPLSAGGAELDFNQVEHACRMALGDKAPADLVIGPMVALLRAGHPLQRVTDYLRSEARRERRKPILTWKLWAELYGRDAAGAAAVPAAALSKPFVWGDDEWRRLLQSHHKTGFWPKNDTIGPAPGEPGCKVPPHLLEAAA